MNMKMLQYVQNGVALLDYLGPEDWRQRLTNYEGTIDVQYWHQDILYAIYEEAQSAGIKLGILPPDFDQPRPQRNYAEDLNNLTRHGLWNTLTDEDRNEHVICDKRELAGHWLAIASGRLTQLPE